MEESRRKRYLEKLDHMQSRLGLAESWISERMDIQERLAAYKAFQEAAEAAADVCAMYLNDEGRPVGDDYENYEAAAGGLFREELSPALAEANGLRNRLVHGYNGLSDETAKESMERLVPELERFVEEVESWVKER